MEALLQAILSQLELICALQIDPEELIGEIKLLKDEIKRLNDNIEKINLRI